MNCNHVLLIAVELHLAFAYDDLSYNKEATQSHTYYGLYTDARYAVDGDNATCMRTNDIGTTSVDNTVWWRVDLGEVFNIYKINILFKNWTGFGPGGKQVDSRNRIAGFSLYVSNTSDIPRSTLCYKNGPQLPPLNFTTTCVGEGRYVIFYNERLDGVNYPKHYQLASVFTELCEVNVLGCMLFGVYGNNCTTPCPVNCKTNTCHIQTGNCLECKPGLTGVYCNEKCREGWYGINCSQPCVGHCRDGNTCNHVTGQCDNNYDTVRKDLMSGKGNVGDPFQSYVSPTSFTAE